MTKFIMLFGIKEQPKSGTIASSFPKPRTADCFACCLLKSDFRLLSWFTRSMELAWPPKLWHWGRFLFMLTPHTSGCHSAWEAQNHAFSTSYLPQLARDHKFTSNATISIRSWKNVVLVARVPKGQYQQRDISEHKLKIRAERSSPCSLARQWSLQRLFLPLSGTGDAKGLHMLALLWLMVGSHFW